MALQIRLRKKKKYLYRDRETGEILESDEKTDIPGYELIGEIEVEE